MQTTFADDRLNVHSSVPIDRIVGSFQDDAHDYQVWGAGQSYLEQPPQLTCYAQFRFLQEAIDYAQYCRARGCNVVLRSFNGQSWHVSFYLHQ